MPEERRILKLRSLLMSNKLYWIILINLYVTSLAIGQDCVLTVRGQVTDEVSSSPLSYANVFIQETQVGTITDDKGGFILANVCPGHYHIIISHIGCQSEKFHFDVTQDTSLNILLTHTPTELGTVVISGKQDGLSKQSNSSINRASIEDNSHQNLSGLLENETGVHLIKNGNGISKPVVHGLYGNRLIVLNNGIVQSGQQWGNDHSPEIDPFAADKITVLKGASILEIGGGNVGSIILSEPNRIEREPHLHGQANYIFESNGRGNTLNLRLGKYNKALAWRVNGTLKKYGDRKTANYLLNNSGVEEANLALQLEKTIKDRLFVDFYASTFNTRLGILRGSQIGNLTDLEAALSRAEPFYTEADFSYTIEAPRQEVAHHLAKIKAKYIINDDRYIEFIGAGQINNRKEFDIRRSGRTDIPSLSLIQYTFNTNINYKHSINDQLDWKSGYQNIVTDNTNNPETGILPLIPDYIAWKNGVYSKISYTKSNFVIDAGARYDYDRQTALTISTSIPREIIRYENAFHNVTGIFAVTRKIGAKQSLAYNAGYSMRNPGINELYSQGLHQGVSGIEEGDISLKMERALKNTLEYKFVPSSDIALNVLVYHQYFNDYIYLNPQEEIRLTIRGAFPVFKYEQTDASIYGLDFSSQFTLSRSLLLVLKYSYLRGQDISQDIPLIFMPPNSLFGSINYRINGLKTKFKNTKLENPEVEINNRFVFRQNNLLVSQDFVPSPGAYNLTSLKFSTDIITQALKIRSFIKADNLFNVEYRDYLNRQRYFADDLGFSLVAGINVKF